jgi:hypothetical protein
MDALRRGFRGATVGASIAGIIAVAVAGLLFGFQLLLDIHNPTALASDLDRLRRFLPLAALAGLFVGATGGLAARLPQKGVRMLKSIAIVAGCAMIARLVVAVQPRYKGSPEPSYMPVILAALLGGVIVLVYGVLATRPKADVDSDINARVTTPDNRIARIDRLWLWVSLVAWGLAAIYVPWWFGEWDLEHYGLAELLTVISIGLLHGGIVMLYFVGIPLRIALNLIFKERRRQRLWETVMCVIAFLSMSLAHLTGILYPPP